MAISIAYGIGYATLLTLILLPILLSLDLGIGSNYMGSYYIIDFGDGSTPHVFALGALLIYKSYILFLDGKNENAKKLMLTSVIYLTFIQLTFLFDKIF